jgi:hypothetical protein
LKSVQTVLALIAVNLLFFIGVEVALRGCFAIRDATRGELPEKPDERALLPAYAGADYDPVETWRELWAGTRIWLNYEPYTVWSRKAISGQYVNVDPAGRRVTRHGYEGAPGVGPSADEVLEIWQLGGSTTWGMGVPDAETIPSRLALLFNDFGVDTRVTNLGDTGMVSTQEVLTLLRSLQTEAPPDLVLFYDGANEPLGVAEAPELLNPHYLVDRIRDLFEERNPKPRQSAVAELWQGSGLFRLGKSLRWRLGLKDAPPPPPPDFENPGGVDSLAARGTAVLFENYGFAEIFGKEFGFRPYFFFQPRPGAGDKPYHPSEEKIIEGLRENAEQDWIMRFAVALRAGVKARLAAGRVPERFYDISDTFAAISDPVYLDWVHLSHRGNRQVAAVLFEALTADLCADPPAHLSIHTHDQLSRACGAIGVARR